MEEKLGMIYILELEMAKILIVEDEKQIYKEIIRRKLFKDERKNKRIYEEKL